MDTLFFTHDGTPYRGLHPGQRKPSASQLKRPNWAVQPYKPKTLAPGDIVRFKRGDQDWRIMAVGPDGIELTRRDSLGQYYRTVDLADEHQLMIIEQKPRNARRK